MSSKIPKYGLNGVFKPRDDNVPSRKITAVKKQKGKYGEQSELRNHNQLLVVANEELQKNLTETQQRMVQLEQQYTDIQVEMGYAQKQLKDCHVLLVAGHIDPVLGERIGQTTDQKEDEQREIVNVSRDLLGELKTFRETSMEQSARLDEIQKNMKDLQEARQHLLQERENFSLEVADLEKALEEAEML